MQSMQSWIKSIFDSPSLRKDEDYSKDISAEGKLGVILVYQDFLNEGDGFAEQEWMSDVQKDLRHLHHGFLEFLHQLQHPFNNICRFLNSEDASNSTFLDFLEVSLKSPNHTWRLFHEPTGNDFVGAINAVLEQHGSPYLLTPFAYRTDIEGGYTKITITAHPKAYLKQTGVVQERIIVPATELLSNPGFENPNSNFLKALDRHRSGDFDGVSTSCVSALEGAIKVAASQRQIEIQGKGLSTLAQSYLSKAGISNKLLKPISLLAESRNVDGDAHGHVSKGQITSAHSEFILGLTALLIIRLV